MTDATPRVLPFSRNRDTPEKGQEHHQMLKDAIEVRYANRIEAAQYSWEVAETNYETLKAELRREPSYWRDPFSELYWLFLLILAVAEVPLNRMSFQLFFSESPTISTIVAGLVGVMLIALAHAIGVMTRRFRHACSESMGGLASFVRILAAIIVVGATSYGVAIFRQGYLSLVTQPTPSFADAMGSGSYGEIAIIALSSSLSVDGWIFMFFNLGLVLVGVLLAFYRHDPHPSFEMLDRERKSTQKSHNTLSARKGDDLAAEDRRFVSECRRKGWSHVRQPN